MPSAEHRRPSELVIADLWTLDPGLWTLDCGLARAGEGNRTLTTSLEGWSSAIELHPRAAREFTWASPTPNLACDTRPNRNLAHYIRYSDAMRQISIGPFALRQISVTPRIRRSPESPRVRVLTQSDR